MTENDKAIEFLTRMGDLLYGRDWIVPLGRKMKIGHRPLCQPRPQCKLVAFDRMLSEFSRGTRHGPCGTICPTAPYRRRSLAKRLRHGS